MGEAEISLKRSPTENSSVGDKLRYVRETKGLSQQDVAKVLFLSVSIIDALEKEDHDKLPAPVFVQGYLKNYAALLGIRVLPKEKESVPVTSSVKLSSHAALYNTSWVSSLLCIISKLFTYIVLAGLVTLFFVWWHERHHAAEKSLSLNNLSVQQDPYPRPALQPLPPDSKPWLDDFRGNTP